jgi:hypothetical protein
VDAALSDCPGLEYCLVLRCTRRKAAWTEGRDRWCRRCVSFFPSFPLYRF